jgi:hypothetical protein
LRALSGTAAPEDWIFCEKAQDSGADHPHAGINEFWILWDQKRRLTAKEVMLQAEITSSLI